MADQAQGELRCPRCGRWMIDLSGSSLLHAVRGRCPDCHAHVLYVPEGQWGEVVYVRKQGKECVE